MHIFCLVFLNNAFARLSHNIKISFHLAVTTFAWSARYEQFSEHQKQAHDDMSGHPKRVFFFNEMVICTKMAICLYDEMGPSYDHFSFT